MSHAIVLDTWEGVAIPDLESRWRLPGIVALRETGSTNDMARSLAEAGAVPGTLVMTEHQSAGRGRTARRWMDTAGRSLLLSFVLRPIDSAREVSLGTAPIRVGMAVARTLRDVARIDARLKWPNDVVAPGAGKLAGILCEAVTARGGTVIIAGIGINVLQQPDDFPDNLRGVATSMAQVAGPGAPSRASIMDALVPAIRPLFTKPLEPLDSDEIAAYAALDALHGLDVTAVQEQSRGRAAGIAADGALLIETAGRVRRITSGSVRITAPHTSTARAQR